MSTMNSSPMLNAYPDSMGGKLSDIVSLLADGLPGAFGDFYILPSLFHSDLDRGFSVIDYDLDERYSSEADLEELKRLGIGLKLDFVLNHQSVQSKEFQDLIENGADSEYRDFFIDWNRFWEGCGELGDEGYIVPDGELIKDMFFRKPGLPILMVDFPDGSRHPYWNTFYQEKTVQPDGSIRYLGQMDVNVKSPLVWESYRATLEKLAQHGARLVRLDAFAYASKEPGKRNFLNEPETWDILQRVQDLAEPCGLSLLPEIHASYEEHIFDELCRRGYLTYDFFTPGLIIHAIDTQSPEKLMNWASEITEKRLRTVNMLGCHDGIPLLDLKGLLPENEIRGLIDRIVARGGYVKDLHGQKNVYYQVNATYFSALGEDEKKLLFARALQMFMPGKPQVWYLDLFAGVNDHDAVLRAGEGGHKEINRTNLSLQEIERKLPTPIVQEQLRLLRYRNTCPAFGFDSTLTVWRESKTAFFRWENDKGRTTLRADFESCDFEISEG